MILLSNKRAKSCQMTGERRLQLPVSVVLSTMQNKDQCDKRRTHTSKPIFCTLLSHIKKPFNPLYLTMPAVLSPRDLFHSGSCQSKLFKSQARPPDFQSYKSIQPVHRAAQIPWVTFGLSSHDMNGSAHIPLEGDVQNTYEGNTHPKHQSKSFLPNHTDTSTGLLKHVTS